MQEKIMKLCMKALEIQRDVISAYKDYKAIINKELRTKKEIKVISTLYNNFLLLFTYAQIVFRNTKNEEIFDDYKDEVEDAIKSIEDIGYEVREFDKNPNLSSITVRCRKDKIRKALKECEIVYKSLYDIGDCINQNIYEFNDDTFKEMHKLVRIYTYRARTLDILMYSIIIMLKYKQ